MLKTIKTLHTLVWMIMVSAVFYIFYAGVTNTFNETLRIALLLMGLEITALLLNRWICPFTTIAKKYTDNHEKANFDIYLPAWLAGNNKSFFSVLFSVGLILVVFNFIKN